MAGTLEEKVTNQKWCFGLSDLNSYQWDKLWLCLQFAQEENGTKIQAKQNRTFQRSKVNFKQLKINIISQLWTIIYNPNKKRLPLESLQEVILN